MDGKLKGHAALWVANIIWGLNAPIGKSVLWSETHPQGVSPFALSVYRMLGACLLFWTVSLFLPREKVAPRDIVLLLFASVFGIQLNQMLFLWGLSLTSPIDTSIIATIVPVLTMVLATLFLREPITWLKAGGVLLGCGGALLLILVSRHGTGGTSSVAGDVLCVISAVSYATYLTAFRNVIVKYSPVTTMKWMFLFAAVAAVAIYYRPLAGVDYAALAPPPGQASAMWWSARPSSPISWCRSGSVTCARPSCRCTTMCSPSWRCCSPSPSGSTPSALRKASPPCASSPGYGWLPSRNRGHNWMRRGPRRDRLRKIGPGHKKPAAENTKLLIVPVLQETDLSLT